MKILMESIIHQLLQNQDGKVWVGTTFKRKLEPINEGNAFIRPIPDMHSVAEIISHLTTWQKETILKIRTGTGRLTDDCEENWFSNEYLMKKSWRTTLQEYEASLAELIAILQTKEDSFLKEQYYDPDFKGNYPFSFIIYGMLHHNLYHLGQIGFTVKFLKKIGQY